jgi:Fe-S-cluster-containing hydrogenase component 2
MKRKMTKLWMIKGKYTILCPLCGDRKEEGDCFEICPRCEVLVVIEQEVQQHEQRT